MRYYASLKITIVPSYYCFLSIEGVSTFHKNWVLVWGEYFLQFGVSGYAIVIKAHWGLSYMWRPNPFEPPLDQKLIAQTQ